MDARCLLRAIDAVAARKSLKQAWIFSASHTITPPGSCIHRKAINKDKPSCPLEVSVLPRIGRIRLREERDQKVSVGLGGIPPWAFRHRSLFKTSLGRSPMPQLPVLPCRTFQAPRKQNSCCWQYKKAPMEPQRYPSPGERLSSSGFLFTTD